MTTRTITKALAGQQDLLLGEGTAVQARSIGNVTVDKLNLVKWVTDAPLARQHIGMTVQKTIEVMQSFNLDPFAYGFICYDSWDDQYHTVSKVVGQDADGKDIWEQQQELLKPAGDLYSFRPDQLTMFMLAGIADAIGDIL